MITVMTLNINNYQVKHGAWNDRKALIAELIRQHRPQVVALQAVKADPRFNDGIDQAEQLAALLDDYQSAVYQPFQHYQDGSSDGTAFLSVQPPLQVDQLPLTLLPGQEDTNQRGLLSALFETEAGPLRFFNAYFSWVPGQAGLNLSQAAGFMSKFEEPALLLGDFNQAPDSEVLQGLREAGWRDAWEFLHAGEAGCTFEAPQPTMRIDYIWTNPAFPLSLDRISILSSEKDGVRLSDHYGLALVLGSG
jgi:endonuclease/exonuclease/phosphatase family metal-dependent hydrolase